MRSRFSIAPPYVFVALDHLYVPVISLSLLRHHAYKSRSEDRQGSSASPCLFTGHNLQWHGLLLRAGGDPS